MNTYTEQKAVPCWTKELPKESGFYWHRGLSSWPDARDIVEWDAADGTVAFAGTDVMLWRDAVGDFAPSEDLGEFWSERLLPPA